MSDIAIRVDNLGKMYRIGRERPRARTLPGRLARAAASPFDWLASQLRGPQDDEILWALRNVSFEVRRGEVLGVIGRNGAGKSTLLKILSRITEPTEGRAEIHGRVGSLLEVGTGMHPELTGRENIYLNGCVLGMKKREIDAKFDEIVAFAGVEKFIDTPVKRYSSGMNVRLGFAVAAHLEPEILVVDEVLAVGDAEFQKKCLGKMHDVAGHGRTILFVSHNMDAVVSLCSRALLMASGGVSMDAMPDRVVRAYLDEGIGMIGDSAQLHPGDDRDTVVYVKEARVEDGQGLPSGSVPLGVPWQVRLRLHVNRRIDGVEVVLGMRDSGLKGIRESWSDPLTLDPGEYEMVFREERVILGSGDYPLLVSLLRHGEFLQVSDGKLRLRVAEWSGVAGAGPKVRGVVSNPWQTSLTKCY